MESLQIKTVKWAFPRCKSWACDLLLMGETPGRALLFLSRKGGCVRISDPVQKKDVLVMSFCKSSTEMLCPSPIPPASTLEIFVEQIDPAWYHKNYWKSPIDFIRVVSGSLQGQVLAVLLPSSVHLIVGICFQLQKRQLTVRTLSIL